MRLIKLFGAMSAVVLVFSAGCATSTETYDERGQRQLVIDCTDQGGWDVCFREASSLCSYGYFLVSRRGEGVSEPAALARLGQKHFREMTIRCK